MDGDDAVTAARSRAASRARGTLLRGQQVAGGGADQVVGVGGQRALRVEARRACRPGAQPPQRGGRHRGMHVDAGQVGRPVAEHAVEVGGGRRRGFRPARLVPAVPPDRAVGMAPRVFGDELQAVSQRRGRAQIEAGERAGRWR